MAIGEHGPDCEGPDEDGDWFCPISSNEPGLCANCLHKYGVETQMTLADTAPELHRREPATRKQLEPPQALPKK